MLNKSLFIFKSVTSIILYFFAINIAFGQHVLFLKNGDKINGKIQEYKNDTLIFVFQGNSLKFKNSEIASIYFDSSFITGVKQENATGNSQKVDGKIYGVITYYFNDNFGDKPDVGAELFFSDSTKIPIKSRDDPFWFRLQPDIIKTMADGSGNYSLKLKAGTYYVLIKSKHRTSLKNIADIDGKCKILKTVVKENSETNLNFSFDKFSLMTN